MTDKIGLVPADHVEIVGQGLILPGLEPPGSKKERKKKKKGTRTLRRASGIPSSEEASAFAAALNAKEQEMESMRVQLEQQLKSQQVAHVESLALKDEELATLHTKNRRLQRTNKQLRSKIDSMAMCLRCGADVKEQRQDIGSNAGFEEDEIETVPVSPRQDPGIVLLVSEGFDLKVLLNFKRLIRSLVLRRRFRAVAMDFKNHKASLLMRLRNESLREIYTSEQKYVASLEKAMEYYYDPMLRLSQQGKAGTRVVSRDDVSIIFSTLEIIVELNRGLLADLKIRLGQWPSVQKFGDLFIRMAPILRLYSGYVRNFEAAAQTLLRKRENTPAFVEFLTESEKRSGLPLESFLIMPVQRLPRYQMLLNGLLKYTDEKHVDFDDISLAQTRIIGICTDINFQKRIDENLRLLRSLVEETEGLLDVFEDEALFVHRGNLHSIKGATFDAYHYILFNDLLVRAVPVVSKRRAAFAVIDAMPLLRIVAVRDVPDMEGIRNCFEIEFNVMKGEGFKVEKLQTIGLCTLTAPEKSLWLARVGSFLDMDQTEEQTKLMHDGLVSFKEEQRGLMEEPSTTNRRGMLLQSSSNAGGLSPSAKRMASLRNTTRPSQNFRTSNKNNSNE